MIYRKFFDIILLWQSYEHLMPLNIQQKFNHICFSLLTIKKIVFFFFSDELLDVHDYVGAFVHYLQRAVFRINLLIRNHINFTLVQNTNIHEIFHLYNEYLIQYSINFTTDILMIFSCIFMILFI